MIKDEDAVRKRFDAMFADIKAIHHKICKEQVATRSEHPPPPARPHIKLPKIVLPTFSGEFTSFFFPFIEMFDTIINHSTELSAIEKFNYLRSSLKGHA